MRRGVMTIRPAIGEIGDRFGGGAENGRGFNPAHGQGKRDGNQRRLTGKGGKHDGQLHGGTGSKPNAVEAVRDVDFGKVDGAKLGVGMPNAIEKTLEGTAELHGLGRGELDGVVVDPIEGQVNNQPWTAIALRDAAQRGEAQPGQVLDQFKGEDGPEALGSKVGHLLANEINVRGNRLMGTAGKTSMDRGKRPRGRPSENRHAEATKMVEKRGGRVIQLTDRRVQMPRAASRRDVCLPGRDGTKTANRVGNNLT
jgi:hypothetical protein